MKKIFILVVMLIACIASAKAQYLVDGLTWNNTHGGSVWSTSLNFTYKVDGDTTINGTQYKLIKENYPDINDEWATKYCLRKLCCQTLYWQRRCN
jgi:hypothetical protein